MPTPKAAEMARAVVDLDPAPRRHGVSGYRGIGVSGYQRVEHRRSATLRRVGSGIVPRGRPEGGRTTSSHDVDIEQSYAC
jgi:hypothetical protein